MSTKVDIPTAIAEFRKLLSTGEWGVPESAEHNTALVLLASACVGPNVRKIAGATGLPYDVVAHIGAQARRHKIWRADKVCAEWDDEENGGIALACDVACVMGLLTRK